MKSWPPGINQAMQMMCNSDCHGSLCMCCSWQHTKAISCLNPGLLQLLFNTDEQGSLAQGTSHPFIPVSGADRPRVGFQRLSQRSCNNQYGLGKLIYVSFSIISNQVGCQSSLLDDQNAGERPLARLPCQTIVCATRMLVSREAAPAANLTRD